MNEGPSIVCNACAHAVKAADRSSHYRSEWHRYNVKRQVSGLAPLPSDVFEMKLAALKTKQGEEAQEKAAHYCAVCNKTCASGPAYTQHINSKLHLKRASNKESHNQPKGGAKEPAPVRIVAAAESDEDDGDEPPELVADEPVRPAGRTGIVYAEPKKKVVKVKQREQEDEDDYEIDESKSIPVKTCLFCNRKFSTIDRSLQHMLKFHGFFVPFTEHLTDMNSLLKYLGAKVGAGRVCLWCNGSFGDVRAIQQHMVDKGHCKINLEDDDEEFQEYYHFPGEELDEDEGDYDEGDEGDEGDEYIPRRGIRDLNAANELVLASGAILGHREHRRIYRQNTRQETELEAADRAHRMLLGPMHSGTVMVAQAERRKHYSESVAHSKSFKNAQKSRLAHEFRANHQPHFVDSTGLY